MDFSCERIEHECHFSPGLHIVMDVIRVKGIKHECHLQAQYLVMLECHFFVVGACGETWEGRKSAKCYVFTHRRLQIAKSKLGERTGCGCRFHARIVLGSCSNRFSVGRNNSQSLLEVRISWQAQYLEMLEGDFCCSCALQWEFHVCPPPKLPPLPRHGTSCNCIIGNAGFQVNGMLWFLPDCALRTLCRSRKARVPWPEKPQLQFTPWGHVRWACFDVVEGNSIHWRHRSIESWWVAYILVGEETGFKRLAFAKHEFDRASCWSFWWFGVPAGTSTCRAIVWEHFQKVFSRVSNFSKKLIWAITLWMRFLRDSLQVWNLFVKST